MLGLPASGKGTQAENIAAKTGSEIIGIGGLVREAVSSASGDSELLDKLKQNYELGIPQSDEIANYLLEEKIKSTSGNLIFDNYPLSLSQASSFKKLVEKYNFSTPEVIYIKIKPNTATTRISSRLVCSKCKKIYLDGKVGDICSSKGCQGKLEKRSDDKPEIIKKRIELNLPRINQMVEFFQSYGKFYEINGEATIPEVENAINKVI